MSNNLITLERYKLVKGINSPTEDAKITLLISSVSDYVKTYLGRSLNDYITAPKIEYFKGDLNKYYLSEFPVLEIVSVEIQEGDAASAYTVLQDNLDYMLDPEYDSIETISGKPFATFSRPKLLKATYKAGYTEIPGDLALAVIDLVTYYLKNEYVPSKLSGGADSIILPPTSNRLPPHIGRVLEMYRQGFTF